MKRLLCILSNMNAGGAETFLMKLYRRLDRSRYQMDFCVNVEEKNDYEDEIVALGGRMYRIPARSDGIVLHDRVLRALIHEHSYRYVLAVSSNATAYLDLKTAKRGGAEICSVRSSNSNLGMSAKSRIIQNLLREMFHRSADVLIAPSDLAAINLFGKNYIRDSRFAFLPNALDIDAFRFSQESRMRIRSEMGIGESTLLVGHVGRFYPQKNHDFLLDVFAELSRIVPESRLLLVGRGDLEQTVREKAVRLGVADQVIFAGLRSDVNAVLSAMDVFVFPSLFEGMPNTVIEAQASGLPCVIADTITREADITGLVKYLPLCDAKGWARLAIAAAQTERRDTKQLFLDRRYDIEYAAERFAQIVFGELDGDQREEKNK